MTIEDEYKLLISAYWGINEMDEYDVKVYVLKDVREYIDAFLKSNYIKNYDILEEEYKDNISLRTKLQNSLIILNRINGPIDLILLIKKRLKELK